MVFKDIIKIIAQETNMTGAKILASFTKGSLIKQGVSLQIIKKDRELFIGEAENIVNRFIARLGKSAGVALDGAKLLPGEEGNIIADGFKPLLENFSSILKLKLKANTAPMAAELRQNVKPRTPNKLITRIISPMSSTTPIARLQP